MVHSVQVINKTKLDTVLQMSKQHQVQLINMVQTMLDAAEDNITLLQQQLSQQQYSEMQQLLHKVRGSFATLGAEQLAIECKQLEHQLESTKQASSDNLQAVVSVYRQTCQAIQAVLNGYQQTSEQDSTALDITQLHSLLLQQDMQACDLAQNSLQALTALLGANAAADFSQLVATLEFAKAAQLLQPYLPANTKAI
ncbi:MAG TPA: Hpt domain-containing protein [Rheinheimera sp.]|nr:Hpt domain-containing protein [Rheinheimera sp.]